MRKKDKDGGGDLGTNSACKAIRQLPAGVEIIYK